jgi:hypothetical protein
VVREQGFVRREVMKTRAGVFPCVIAIVKLGSLLARSTVGYAPVNALSIRPAGLLCLICCASMLLGCTGKPGPRVRPTFPVRGQVFYEGRPVARALVVLHPRPALDDPPVLSFARTETYGSFQISTYKPNDGAPAGKYAVAIIKEDDQEGVHLLPSNYASPDTSGFTVEVREEDNTLPPFRLRRPD